MPEWIHKKEDQIYERKHYDPIEIRCNMLGYINKTNFKLLQLKSDEEMKTSISQRDMILNLSQFNRKCN